MQRDNHHIDRIFRDGLQDFEADLPPYVWENVENSLNRSRKLLLRKRLNIAAAAVFALFSFVSGYMLTNLRHRVEPVAVAIAEQNTQFRELVDSLSALRAALNAPNLYQEAETVTIQTPDWQEKNATSRIIPMHTETPKKSNPVNTNMLAENKDDENTSQEHSTTARGLPNYYNTLTWREAALLKADRMSRWEVGGQFSPVYAYRHTSVNETLLQKSATTIQGSDQNMSYYDEVESGIASFSGGVSVKYNASNRLSVQSGVFYWKYGQVTADFLSVNKYYPDNNIITTSAGTVEPLMPTETTESEPLIAAGQAGDVNLIQNFQYLEIPLLVSYRLIEGKVDFSILGGMATNILVGNNAYLRNATDKQWIGQTTDLNSVLYSGTVGVGMDYALTRRVSFNIEPSFRYSLSSMTKGQPLSYNPYTFALFTGVRYRF